MLSVIAIACAGLWLALLAAESEGSVLGPAPFLILMWSGYILSSLLFVSSGESLQMGLLWILLSLVTVFAGSIFAGAVVSNPVPSGPSVAVDVSRPFRRRIKMFALTAMLIGSVNILHLFTVRGYSPSGILSFAVIAQVSALNRGELYEGILEQGSLQRLSFVVMFLGSIYGGLLFRVARTRAERLLGMGPLLAVSVLYALFGSRMGVLYGGSFWISAYLACHVLVSRDRRTLPVRFLFQIGITSVVVLLGLSTLTQVVRYAATQELDWYKMLADPFAFVAAFGIWFDASALDQERLLWGARTFRRLFEFFGLRYEVQPAIEVGFTSSNIYSVFRDLIEDFGLFGSLVVTALLGFGGRVAFLYTSHRCSTALPWLVLSYAFALTSFASGFLQYTTTTVAVAAFVAIERAALPSPRRECV